MVMTETPPYPLILPLADAAREMGVDEATLRDMVKLGKIRAFVDPEGVMYVQMTQQGTLPVAVAEDTRQPPDDINARLSRIRREDFAHLEGVPITVSEAARKYGIGKRTLQKWLSLYGKFIKILEEARGPIGAKLNEADVAYFVAIHQTRKAYGVRSGTPLVDEEGKPNLLKHPLLSLYRRSQ